MSANGTSGELRLGYQVAARLGRWTLTAEGAFEAAVVEVNEFWISQPGSRVLIVPLGRRQWVWRDVDLLDQGPPLRLRVTGAPELR